MRLRLAAFVAVLGTAAALVSVGVAATMSATSLPQLHGTIGPGFTISLKDAHGKAVQGLADAEGRPAVVAVGHLPGHQK